MNVEIDLTGEDSATVTVEQHCLSDNEINISGLSLLLNHDQLDKLHKAMKLWFDEI